MRTFRIDRISDVPAIMSERAVKKPAGFSGAGFVGTNYRMFAGEVTEVTLICDNDTMDSIIDRFGEKVETEPVDDRCFRLKAKTAETHVFFAWVFGFGGKVKIEGPDNIKTAYRKMLKDAQS